ncbi:MAG: FecR domain-containing protein [Elusimicrobia bacterium]|nr:FecR domain-containing protein [Elusimicrobiota bacterium]
MKISLLLLVLLVPAVRAAEPVSIGAAAAVSGAVSAAAPGAATRSVESGARMFHKDAVTTDAQGRLQVMLLDETVFTMGPGSRIVLDEFVYDPFTSAGKVTAEVTKGVFRFVSGKTARRSPEGLKVKLPVGTLGIRGTIAGGKVEGDSALIALLGPGQDNNADERPGAVSVENAGTTVMLDEPGTATRIPSAGEPPSPPFVLTPELLAELSAAPPGGDSGSEPAAGGSASEESGQETAAGKVGAGDTLGLDDEQQSLAEASAFASQSLGSGVFTWEDLRAAIQSGTAFYDGTGNYSCSGGACGGGNSGNFALHFNVNWGDREIGGPSPQTSHFAITTGPLNTGTETPASNIPFISFAALSGGATLTQGPDFSGSDSNFDGSSFTFKDARTVEGTLQYSIGGATASGNVTSPCISGDCPP